MIFIAPQLTRFFAIAVLFIMASSAGAQDARVVQPFADSKYVAQYAVEFDQFTILEGDVESHSERTLEGQRKGAILILPEGKGSFEVLRSFENALKKSGFTILFSGQVDGWPMKKDIGEVYKKNRVYKQPYENIGDAFLSTNDIGYIVTFPEYYLSASIIKDGQETVFVLNLGSERSHYLMEEITTAAMEENTVTINEEMLVQQIEEAGKAILHGIEFDTGSAAITASSAASLQIIANVLKAQSGNFYIVGHTDDTGTFDNNMTLSRDRAAAVILALAKEYGIDAGRLQAGGVGPLSPIASNANAAGKTLNRRVELVRRLME